MIHLGVKDFTVSSSSVQGGRLEQQDRFIVQHDDKGFFLAVFDGHGGSAVADICQTFGPEIWGQIPSTDPTSALYTFVEDLNEMTSEYQDCGSTLSAVFIPPPGTLVHYAVLGDSPVIVKDLFAQVRVAPLHNVNYNLTEHHLAIERGGIVWDGYLRNVPHGAGVQLSRSLGDGFLGPLVSKEPQIGTFDLGRSPGDYVLVGTDGIFDLSRDRTIASEIDRVALLIANGGEADTVVELGDSSDNATAILLRRT